MERVPLSNSFTVFALVGFIISVILTAFGTWDIKIGFTLSVVFFIFIIASIFSITPAKEL